MEKQNSKRKLIIIVSIISVLVLTLGGSLALWTYFKVGSNQQLIAGDIYMKYTGVNNLSIKDAMPSLTYEKNNYFEFNIVGKNTHKEDIVYEIVLDHGDEPEDENRTERIKDGLLKFRLVEVKDGEEEELIQEGSYDELVKRRIWVDRVKAGTKEEETHTYRLYMWVSIDTKIGNVEQDYTLVEWDKVFASVKVTVNGDLNEKELTEDYMILNAVNESGEAYDLKQPIESREDITLTLASKREVTKFVVSKSSLYPIALMSLEEPTDYEASYNDKTRSWEAKVTIDETGIYDYYAEYEVGKNSKTYSFTILMNPDRFVKIEKPTSALCKQGLTYTGSPQDLIDESNLDQVGYTITQTQATTAGSHQVMVKLKDKYKWMDGSLEDTQIDCNIEKAKANVNMDSTSGSTYVNGKKKITITSNATGNFNITDSSSSTASGSLSSNSGKTTTLTITGKELGSTDINVTFQATDTNYNSDTIKLTYNIKVIDSLATTVIKSTIGEKKGVIGVSNNNEKVTSENSNIREYRYSGKEVNNYIKFNDETWRIVGVFKDGGDETIKIVRNDMLLNVIPKTYYANGTTYNLDNAGYTAYFKSPTSDDGNGHYNDWAESGLQYWLNSKGSSGGYLTSLTSTAQQMITSKTYYLGNIGRYENTDSPIEAYNHERGSTKCATNDSKSCKAGQVWYENSVTWSGKIGLLYPSDVGFSADSSYWNTSLDSSFTEGAKTSWLSTANRVYREWLISPCDLWPVYEITFETSGYISYAGVNLVSASVRPSVHLNKSIKFISGDGSSSDPYELSLS